MNVIDFISNREKHIKETMANEGSFLCRFLVKTEILTAVLTGYMWLTSLVMNHQ